MIYDAFMHPSQEIKGIKNNFLKNKQIVLGVTGSIAAVEMIKLSRELIRYGVDIIPVMTPAATSIIHPDALWFATGKKPIITLTGETEHVSYCGNVRDAADLLLICPCTANTLSKIAHGIDDTAVTTFATTAIGAHHPVILVPAMHQSMYDHPIIQENIRLLENSGYISVIRPILDGKKAKLPSISTICSHVVRSLSEGMLSDKKILIIGGACNEPVDMVRSLCNHSSGKTALSFATHAFYQGADVVVWYGVSSEPIPEFLHFSRFQTVNDVYNLIKQTDMKKFDIILVCASLSDYIPKFFSGKIDSTQKSLTITCLKSNKVLKIIREKTKKSILIGFKLGVDKKDVIAQAQNLQKKLNLDLVIANTTDSLHNENTQAWIIKNTKISSFKGSKKLLPEFVFKLLGKK